MHTTYFSFLIIYFRALWLFQCLVCCLLFSNSVFLLETRSTDLQPQTNFQINLSLATSFCFCEKQL